APSSATPPRGSASASRARRTCGPCAPKPRAPQRFLHASWRIPKKRNRNKGLLARISSRVARSLAPDALGDGKDPEAPSRGTAWWRDGRTRTSADFAGLASPEAAPEKLKDPLTVAFIRFSPSPAAR